MNSFAGVSTGMCQVIYPGMNKGLVVNVQNAVCKYDYSLQRENAYPGVFKGHFLPPLFTEPRVFTKRTLIGHCSSSRSQPFHQLQASVSWLIDACSAHVLLLWKVLTGKWQMLGEILKVKPVTSFTLLECWIVTGEKICIQLCGKYIFSLTQHTHKRLIIDFAS